MLLYTQCNSLMYTLNYTILYTLLGYWVKKTHRLHVAIVTGDKVDFLVGPTEDRLKKVGSMCFICIYYSIRIGDSVLYNVFRDILDIFLVYALFRVLYIWYSTTYTNACKHHTYKCVLFSTPLNYVTLTSAYSCTHE